VYRLIPVVVLIAAFQILAAPAAAEDMTWCDKALLDHDNGRLESAVERYTRCIEQGDLGTSSLAIAHSNRGLAWLDLGDHANALPDFERAIELDPGWALYWTDRADLHVRSGDYVAAIADYNEALARDPENTGILLDRAIAWGYLGDLDMAMADFGRVETLAPDWADLYFQRGRAWSDTGEHLRAIVDFDQAIALDDGHADAYNSRAWALYMAGGDLDQAFADLEIAFSILGEDWYLLDTLAHILAARGQHEAALTLFERIMELEGASVIVGYQDGLAYGGYYVGPLDGRYTIAMRQALEACIRDACTLWGY